jgi:transglutaminase-like putative cysteine protease
VPEQLKRVVVRNRLPMTDQTSHVRATPLLDYGKHELQRVVHARVSADAKPDEAVRALYAFVSSLPLGYNRNDTVSASRVLADGYGQCNTKTTLLCALVAQEFLRVCTRTRSIKMSKNAVHPIGLLRACPRQRYFFGRNFS